MKSYTSALVLVTDSPNVTSVHHVRTLMWEPMIGQEGGTKGGREKRRTVGRVRENKDRDI